MYLFKYDILYLCWQDTQNYATYVHKKPLVRALTLVIIVHYFAPIFVSFGVYPNCKLHTPSKSH